MAGAWALVGAVVALIWTIIGRGFPFGKNDPDAELAVLGDLPADVGAPVFAAGWLLTAVMALAMSGRNGGTVSRWSRRLLLGWGWTAAVTLLVIVPDTRLLALAGYAPLLIFGAPFDVWDEVNVSEVFDWSLGNQIFAPIGGFLVAATVLAWQRRTAGQCQHCGRSGGGVSRWTQPDAVARWGRWAVGVAVVVPLLYAVTRLAWFVRIPLLVSDEFVEDLHREGAHVAGASLGAFAVVGGVLTLGLVQRWGERFPGWMVGLRGTRVPIKLATIPASVVAVFVMSAGIAMVTNRRTLEMLGGGEWLIVSHIFWPLWGVALAVATYAYYVRRRGPCLECGRG